jgi:hypothetical protein
MATAKSTMKKGELRHIHIEPATDGSAVLRLSKKSTEGKNKGPWLSDSSEETHTHPTPEEAGKHVTEILRQHFHKESPKATDSAADKKKWGNKSATGKSEPMSDDGPDAELA